ncbi:MAG: GPP34 family phosphoprotein [Gammaproteobacteria bacterium]|nr:GPP34 family phosphoprotein [Gammaproteobacteria bacterium]MYE85847.1 GPP34 family phosphoprotein [Gammaproteobacteria bacterium]MYF10610.1 GPP34 family phosphoprotein [Gammaproteobacteria bacterium]MYF49447.1 GPP34 family phosphoprotein [Gammaproteobacteria bacterium]MYG14791.1 GPP34 family phosphoprotein [Gammaproteobacteria bacterium]
MLTFTEEILLLLGDEEGTFLPIRQHAFECALAGAVLMDLAFAHRIDTDLEALIVITADPTGNPMLDAILAKIASRTGTADTQSWIRALSTEDAAWIREQALSSLVDRGILERREERFLWAFGTTRHPTLDEAPKRHIKDRIARALADAIPAPRDIALISLAHACQVLPELFAGQEIEPARIALLRRMDLIGREVADTIADLQRTIVRAAQAQAQRTQKRLLSLSVASAAITSAIMLAPRIPVPDRFGTSVLQELWLNGFWQQWSGYLLLALSVAGLVVGVAVRKRLISQITGLRRWRLAHIAIGVACTLALFIHTGFRLGANVNAALMGFYVATLLSGALAGIAVGAAHRLRQMTIGRVGRPRNVLLWLHVMAICPLPALLAVHIAAAYLY